MFNPTGFVLQAKFMAFLVSSSTELCTVCKLLCSVMTETLPVMNVLNNKDLADENVLVCNPNCLKQ